MPLFRHLILILLSLAITPFLALLAAVLLSFNLIRRAVKSSQRRPRAAGAAPPGPASIIILNWDGKDLLAQGLPSVLEAVRADDRGHEVLVVDNGSTDGSREYLAREFPQVRVVPLPQNLGFAGGNNAGVRAARHDIVVLLNNDMVVDRAFLRPLLAGFGPNTFAVSSQIFLQDPSARREETGHTAAVFRRGMIDYSHRPVDGRNPMRSCYPAFWAGGGSSAFHRSRYLELGGFRDLYSPAYVEDTDLSYRSWKRGWEVLFAPASVVYHKHRASSSRRFDPLALQSLVQRNQFLFIWSNIESFRLLLSHCLFLPWNCYRLGRDFGLGIWRAIFRAILRLPAALREGLKGASGAVRPDQEVFALTSHAGLFFGKNPGDSRFAAPGGDDPRPRILWMTAYLPHLGKHAGAGRMYQLLKRIAGNYRVTLLSFLENEEERDLLPDLEAICERVAAMRRVPPPRWQIFPYEPFDEFRTPQMMQALNDAVESVDYSLVQLEYTQMASYADKALGLPTLLTKHEVDFAACARRLRVESNPGSKLRWFYNYLQVLDREIGLQRRTDVVICMTDTDAAALRPFCASVPIEVINTGVDLEYFVPPPIKASSPRLVFVGAFQHMPNSDAMTYFCAKILPLIRARVPSVELLIVGSNPTPEVLRLAEIPGVQVTGSVPDIRPYMASSSVYIVPLRLGVGIRGKILEAWGMGMAVVATSLACAGLRKEDGKNLLIADADRQFADCAIQLLCDPALRDKIGMEGRRTVEAHYGWEASARKLDALYRRMIRTSSCCLADRIELVGSDRP